MSDKKKDKEFIFSTWAINHRTAIFILTFILILFGLKSYNSLPKESFPDISLPNIYVSVLYPGTSPKDMENLVVRPIEKECKSIAGVKKIKSNSLQDYCNVIVEFNSDVKIDDAKAKVKDAVDRAKSDLPQDLPNDPQIMDINFADLPVMYVNIAGNYDLKKLKEYADDAKEKLEAMREIKQVDMIGALEREIQVNVDMLKMQASGLSMYDIYNAVHSENATIPGGTVNMDGVRRSLSVTGEFKSADQIGNIVINSIDGKPVYLKDIAEVVDSHKEQESFARLDHQNVITLSIVKRKGENLINASDKIVALVDDLKENSWPKDLKVALTGDQSEMTRNMLHDLINTIIIGFILVFVVLMFFMGVANAFFVAMSVPLSMCLAFMVLPAVGFTLNMIVLFSFLMALGIVVDDAIVVIENTHRIFANGKKSIIESAKLAAGEVFAPVLSGTLTTIAPFFPLLFWKGIMGKFMFFLPVTLIITLFASLLIAYIINPVLAVRFMKPHNDNYDPKKGLKVSLIIFGIVIVGGFASGYVGVGTFGILVLLLNLLNRFWLRQRIEKFKNVTWPAVQNRYRNMLTWCLHRPWQMIMGTVGVLIFSIVLFAFRHGPISYFPQADPNFVFVFTSLPVGTDQAYTDSVTKIIEAKVYKAINWPDNKLVKSVITNVTVGVTDPQDEDQGSYPNKSKIQVAFVEYGKRNGASTRYYLDKIREAVRGSVPGAEITVNQEQGGPPVAKPINIEISGDNYEELATTSVAVKKYLDSLRIDNVEELRSDLQDKKPQVTFNIDRERANREAISTTQIGREIQAAVLGWEASKFRDAKDDYKIMLRYREDQRYNVDMLKNLKILYRDMAMNGMVRNVPLASFADIKYEDTYGVIKRKNQKRLITISSNVLDPAKQFETVAEVQRYVNEFQPPSGVSIVMTGEQEAQAEDQAFLNGALMASILLIVLILVIQFNSFSKPLIILTEIFFSVIGFLLGFSIFKMEVSSIMCMVGIIALAGIVVRNGILLVEFTDELRARGVPVFDAIVEAGRIRMTPVILTASATMLGLIPLAIGLNIDFSTLFTNLNPHIYLGGDMTAFWGPLSWTMIFGLGFATFLTLILVPVMYLLSERIKNSIRKWRGRPIDIGVLPKPVGELVTASI